MQLEGAFKSIDRDGSGAIDRAEMKQVSHLEHHPKEQRRPSQQRQHRHGCDLALFHRCWSDL